MGGTASAATRRGGGAGEIRTRERGTPVTAFPVRTPETTSFLGLQAAQLQFDMNSTSSAVQLFFNGTLFLEMPSHAVSKCRDLLLSYGFVFAIIWMIA